MYDYEAFWKKYPVDIHDLPERHIATAGLCRGKVLDIGCGSGCLADYFAGDYTGFDISGEAIKKARETRRKNALFFVHDCATLSDFDFSPYDTIVLCEFLEHIMSDEQIFAAIKKTARVGTRIVISTPNGDAIPCDEHVREFTVPELRKKFAPLGRVKFHNWHGFNRQILLSVDFGHSNSADLGLVMIAKNEEKGLEKTILSCIDFVGEIVIAVDESSTDNTKKIAQRYADIVKDYKFADDFAVARNFAHEGMVSRWLLFLDGHEFVSKCEDLERMLTAPAEALVCTIKLENGSTFRNPRIYRNGLQFVGSVHEVQNCNTTVLFPNFVVTHDRLSGQTAEGTKIRDNQRDDQVPRLMKAQLAKDPKNLRASFHLALHYHSKQQFKKSIKYQKKYLKHSKLKSERWYILFNKSLCYLSMNKFFRAFWAACAADDETPGRWEIDKLKGLIYFGRKKYAKALGHLIASFRPNTIDTPYQPWEHDDSGTWNLAGECFFNLRQYFEAQQAFKRAAELCKEEAVVGVLKDRAELMSEIARG